VLPDSGRVEVTDTFRPSGRALNGLGDSVMAQLSWSSLDTDKLAILDSTTGVSLSRMVGIARLQARTTNLISNPQPVSVLAKLDSVQASGATRDTVKLSLDSTSAPLQVQAFATGGAAVGRRVVYAATTYPPRDSAVTFVPRDVVTTGSTGIGSARLKLRPGVVPDSVVVSATMTRLNGTTIPGSPVTFVVEFRP